MWKIGNTAKNFENYELTISNNTCALKTIVKNIIILIGSFVDTIYSQFSILSKFVLVAAVWLHSVSVAHIKILKGVIGCKLRHLKIPLRDYIHVLSTFWGSSYQWFVDITIGTFYFIHLFLFFEKIRSIQIWSSKHILSFKKKKMQIPDCVAHARDKNAKHLKIVQKRVLQLLLSITSCQSKVTG